MKNSKCVLDFETRSEADLKKTGAFKYSIHPSTRPTCLSIKVGRESPQLLPFEVVNLPWAELNPSFRLLWRHLLLERFLFVAHNAFFEQVIYYNILVKRNGWPQIPVRQWRCTAAKAAACALPRNLEGAGAALNLTTQKDKRGYAAVMATCKPTKEYRAWQKKKDTGQFWLPGVEADPPPIFLEPDKAPDVFKTLYTYCGIDTETEFLLDEALPDLTEAEQELWFLNQRLNWRGFRVDIPTARKVVKIMKAEDKTKLQELDTVTMGLVTKPGARQSIIDFLAAEGMKISDVRKKTVEDALKEGNLSRESKKLLELRQALSKTSTRKYQAFLDRADETDHRVRDILLYHGGHTGRDSGTGIQPQNFPKPVTSMDPFSPYRAVEDISKFDPEALKLFYGENLSLLFSSVLRNMILPTEGKELFVADFAKIEVGVCWWIADNKPGLRVLNSGKDPYIYMAAANTGKSYEEIEDPGSDRDLGKAQTLGAQFGMGWEKFQETAWAFYRLKLTDEQSQFAINSYRQTNPAVPRLWKDVERAAVNAVESGGVFKAGKCRFFVKNKFLWIELPSGRRLAYREPQIVWRETDYGPRKGLEFWATNPKTKKWELQRTWGGTLVENMVQAIARDLMMYPLLDLEEIGYQVLLTVHDEVIAEREIGLGTLEEFTKILCKKPSWTDDELPLEAKGFVAQRYRK